MTYKKNPSPVDDSTSESIAEIPVTGEAEIITQAPKAADMDTALADQKFNEERVKIYLHPSMSEHDSSRLVSVGVNGEKKYLVSGRESWVKRKHLERLIYARPELIEHQGVKNDMTGKEQNVFRKTAFSRYNFEVLEDPNPKGREWLAGLRRAAK